jgi:hypothetical protein
MLVAITAEAGLSSDPIAVRFHQFAARLKDRAAGNDGLTVRVVMMERNPMEVPAFVQVQRDWNVRAVADENSIIDYG